MNKILVTGASGNIGAPLVEALRWQGADFEILRSKAAEATAARVASFADEAGLTAAFAGVDTLFVLLPLVPDKLDLAKNVARAAVAAGVKHIVRSSGAGADPEASFALPRLQGTIDRVFADTGIATTARPPSLVDVRDIAAVAATILADPHPHAGKAYTLTGAEALTDSERVRILSDVLGRDVRFVEVSVAAASASMAQMGTPPVVVEWLDSLNELVSQGYAGAISPDTETLLGRAPGGFRQYAHDQAAAWA